MDLANGVCERDLVYLLAWDTLMLSVHNETIFENLKGALGDEIDITDCDRASSGMPRIRPNRAESDDINI